jgi:PPM family protein phosphatase
VPTSPDKAPEAPVEAGPTPADANELEELTFPPSVEAPEALPIGTELAPEGRLRILEHLGARGRINRYAATWEEQAGEAVDVELREGPVDHDGLRREAEVLGDLRYGMLPKRYAAFEYDGRRYLALERLGGETLAQALDGGLDLEGIVSIVLQLAQALRRLHEVGWAPVGLAPADVLLGQPVRITQLGTAARIGQAPPGSLHIAGYSAPELAHPAGAVVTGKEDVYTLGAILYRALSGQPVPEAGVELSQLPSLVPVPGGPQLLTAALAPADERLDLEAFYGQLLALKQRFARAAATIALEVASGTTVGLNPTRLVNEDSCGYVTWSVSGAEGVVYRALLCVADGMGGMEAGEVASGTALRVVLSGTTTPPPPDAEASGAPDPGYADRLDPVALIREAAPVVHAAGQGRQMGTTCTVVAVHGDELTLGHVGDTRAYLLRGGALTQLTNDHSLVAAMVASGVLTKEEARGHPDSNKVLRSLGGQRELPERYVDSLEAACGQSALQLQPGDWVLLCSDGVWGSVDDESIREVTLAAPDPQTVARVLVERALAAGAPDNAAILAARCVRVPSA